MVFENGEPHQFHTYHLSEAEARLDNCEGKASICSLDLRTSKIETIQTKDEEESPYCPTCGACGEAGCCPPTKCKEMCKYGDLYLAEANEYRDYDAILRSLDVKDSPEFLYLVFNQDNTDAECPSKTLFYVTGNRDKALDQFEKTNYSMSGYGSTVVSYNILTKEILLVKG